MKNSLFSEGVLRTEVEGIELILNFDNGAIVGLTTSGACVLDKLIAGEIEFSEAIKKEPELMRHLDRAEFFAKGDKKHTPLSIYYHVTQRCNLNCAGCYSLDDTRNSAEDVSGQLLCAGLKKLSSLPIDSITFSGGEPFLRCDMVSILRYAKLECGFPTVRVITNGTLLQAETVYEIAYYVDEIAVSFDGFSAESSSWVRGKQNFEVLSSLVKDAIAGGVSPHIISTIHSKNIDDVYACRSFAQELGVPYHFSLLSCDTCKEGTAELVLDDSALEDLYTTLMTVRADDGKGVLSLLSAIRAKKVCGCGKSVLSIGHDGSIYPCHMLHSSQYKLGNLYSDYESGEEVLAAAHRFETKGLGVDGIEGCKSCEVRYICGGGCRARSFYSSGSLDCIDPYCALMKKYYGRVFSELSQEYSGR